MDDINLKPTKLKLSDLIKETDSLFVGSFPDTKKSKENSSRKVSNLLDNLPLKKNVIGTKKKKLSSLKKMLLKERIIQHMSLKATSISDSLSNEKSPISSSSDTSKSIIRMINFITLEEIEEEDEKNEVLSNAASLMESFEGVSHPYVHFPGDSPEITSHDGIEVWIECPSKEVAEAAKATLDGMILGGVPLQLEIYSPQSNLSSRDINTKSDKMIALSETSQASALAAANKCDSIMTRRSDSTRSESRTRATSHQQPQPEPHYISQKNIKSPLPSIWPAGITRGYRNVVAIKNVVFPEDVNDADDDELAELLADLAALSNLYLRQHQTDSSPSAMVALKGTNTNAQAVWISQQAAIMGAAAVQLAAARSLPSCHNGEDDGAHIERASGPGRLFACIWQWDSCSECLRNLKLTGPIDGWADHRQGLNFPEQDWFHDIRQICGSVSLPAAVVVWEIKSVESIVATVKALDAGLSASQQTDGDMVKILVLSSRQKQTHQASCDYMVVIIGSIYQLFDKCIDNNGSYLMDTPDNRLAVLRLFGIRLDYHNTSNIGIKSHNPDLANTDLPIQVTISQSQMEIPVTIWETIVPLAPCMGESMSSIVCKNSGSQWRDEGLDLIGCVGFETQEAALLSAVSLDGMVIGGRRVKAWVRGHFLEGSYCALEHLVHSLDAINIDRVAVSEDSRLRDGDTVDERRNDVDQEMSQPTVPTIGAVSRGFQMPKLTAELLKTTPKLPKKIKNVAMKEDHTTRIAENVKFCSRGDNVVPAANISLDTSGVSVMGLDGNRGDSSTAVPLIVPLPDIPRADSVLDEKLFGFLKSLADFQQRALEKNPANAKLKQRFVLGIKQSINGVKAKKAKLVCLAPDTECSLALDVKLLALIQECQNNRVPILFCLSRRRLGRSIGSSMKQSALTVYDADGAFDVYRDIVAAIGAQIVPKNEY